MTNNYISRCRQEARARGTVAEEELPLKRREGVTAEVGDRSQAIVGWLAFRKDTGCRPGGDPETKRYRATKLQ